MNKMNKIKKMLVSTIAIVALSTMNAFAGEIGFGVTGSFAGISGNGSEKDTNRTSQNASAYNSTSVGSMFAEYTLDGDHGMTFGVDYIPGSANVNAKTLSRTDTESSVEDTETTTTTSVTRSAQGKIDNHLTYYAELPIHGGLYGKLGYATMDVTTQESFASSKAYGNTSVDGVVMGIGFKSDIGSNAFYKVEGTHTNYGGFTLNETGQTTNSDQNSITVSDIVVNKGTFAIGFKF